MPEVRIRYIEFEAVHHQNNTESTENHKMGIYAADGQMAVPQQADADNFPAFVKYTLLGHPA